MPVPTRYLKYGNYVFPQGFHVADDGLQWVIPQAKLPRTDGARLLAQTFGPKRVLVRGGFIRGPFNQTLILREQLDSLRAALNNSPARLYLYDDRYYRCAEVEEFRNPYEPTHFERMALGIEISFLMRDPFMMALTASSDTWSSPINGGTRTITTAGNALARPTLSFTVAGSGAQSISWTLTNNTTGEQFTLIGSVTGGDVIAVDTLLETCKIGATDKMSMFDGQFLRLNVGANTLSLSISSGSITQILTAWNDRWL